MEQLCYQKVVNIVYSIILLHIAHHKRDECFNVTLDSILPGVHNCFDNQIFAIQASNAKVNIMQNSIRSAIQDYEDFKQMYTA